MWGEYILCFRLGFSCDMYVCKNGVYMCVSIIMVAMLYVL